MTKINNFEKYISTLDSDRFGFKIAKLDFNDIDAESAVRELKNLDVKMVMTRINAKNIELVNRLEELGFRIKDSQLKYLYELKNFQPQEINLSENHAVREVRDADIPVLTKFTQESFEGYGHYFADKRLNAKKCMEIYKDWVLRSCKDKNTADKVFVAEINGEAAGYLTFKIFQKDNLKYAAGGLGAVSKLYRNKSIFQAIILHGLKWGAEINLEWEEHNVLTTNYSVNRSFSKLGFRVANSYYTLHGWI